MELLHPWLPKLCLEQNLCFQPKGSWTAFLGSNPLCLPQSAIMLSSSQLLELQELDNFQILQIKESVCYIASILYWPVLHAQVLRGESGNSSCSDSPKRIWKFFMLRFSKENLWCSVYLQQEMACCEVITIFTSQALPTSNSVIKLSGKARNWWYFWWICWPSTMRTESEWCLETVHICKSCMLVLSPLQLHAPRISPRQSRQKLCHIFFL